MRRIVISLALLAAAGGCATAASPPPARSTATASSDRGRFFVLRSCAGCHAVGPLGSNPNNAAPSFGAVRLRYNAPSLQRRLNEISRNGHIEMPPIYMSDDEIGDIVAYIETVEPPAARDPLPGSRQVKRAGALAS